MRSGRAAHSLGHVGPVRGSVLLITLTITSLISRQINCVNRNKDKFFKFGPCGYKKVVGFLLPDLNKTECRQQYEIVET